MGVKGSAEGAGGAKSGGSKTEVKAKGVGRSKSVFRTISQYRPPAGNAAVVTDPNTPLSQRELKLLRLLVDRDGEITHTQAAILAGFPRSRAASELQRLLDPSRSPHFVRALRVEQSGLEAQYAATRFRHMRDLQRLRDQAAAAGNWSAAVSAEHKRGLASPEGLYVSRSEVRTGSLDSMSREDVMRELERLRQEYSLDAIEGEVVREEVAGAPESSQEESAPSLPLVAVEDGASPERSCAVSEGGDEVETPDSDPEEDDWLRDDETP